MKRNFLPVLAVLPVLAMFFSVPALADIAAPPALSGGLPWVYLIIAVVVIAVVIIARQLRRARRRRDGMR